MSMISHSEILTDDGARIVKRLCNHWKHKFEITENDGKFEIPFPDAKVVLQATATQIIIDIHTEKSDVIEQCQNVVVNHLNRMAQQEFSTEWHTTSD